MSRQEIRHELARMEQDRQFIQNAHIRQKIYGGLFAVFCLVLWAALTNYDHEQIWHGLLLVPLACFGIWLMITKRNEIWRMKNDD